MHLLKSAAFLIALSGLLHIVTLLFGRFPDETLPLLALGIVYQGLAIGVASNRRWAAWLGFSGALAGAIGALNAGFNVSDIPALLFTAIAVINTLAAISLFWNLWKSYE